MPPAPPLIEVTRLDLRRGGRTVLRELTWRLERGRHWAILGGNGAGKSSFLAALRGDLRPAPGAGSVTWWLAGQPTTMPALARPRVALVAAERQQQLGREEWAQSGRELVAAGLFGERFLYRPPTAAQWQRVDRLLAELALTDLAARDPRTLSQGETRRLLLAQALVAEPAVLLLDEPVAGLAAAARRELLALLDRAAARASLVCAAHRAEDLPACLTDVARIVDGRLVPAALPRAVPTPPRAPDAAPGEPLLELAGVTVCLHWQPVLHDLQWTVRRGEQWRVTGGNGAGKSTLLRLLHAELWPALGGQMRWFGRPRWPVWELRRRIGYLSPDLQTRYDGGESVAAVVGSGFTASVGLVRQLTAVEQQQVDQALATWDLAALRQRPLYQLSNGQARRALLARALVGRPELLLLDEALDGLDAATLALAHRELLAAAAAGATLVQVSHHDGDLVPLATQELTLAAGRIV
ncbi:MAG: ATP-binding cassette domain-containing protein [Fimbriimonadaceae bacterium]|nr:ATP-binding cassette domain-containing protein [Fimbriimonadaceae bacterium]